MKSWKFILSIALIQLVFVVNGERTRDKMYKSVAGASCFRKLNATHQIGCSSSFSGSVGVLHLINSQQDIDFIVQNPPAPPYAPVISAHLFTRENILRLKNEGGKNVSVIVLINKLEQMKNFSHELQCPNQFSGLVSKEETCNPDKPETVWNPYGTGLLHEDFPFPIYYVYDTEEINEITQCFQKFNNFDLENQARRSLCSIEVNTFMSAAVNAEVCFSRTLFINNLSPTKFCDPLEGKNIFATLFPRKQSLQTAQREVNKTEKFILLSARIDTTSLFDGVGLGAMDSLMSYATLVGAAHILSRILPHQKHESNVLYMLFNGESYDYIGSQRFVYDIQKLAFPPKSTQTDPIGFENIMYMIDIGTLDELADLKLYHATDFDYVQKFLQQFRAYNEMFKFVLDLQAQRTLNLPPTSAQSVLRVNSSFPAVIINSKPENRYYHSSFDDAINIGFRYRNTSLDFTKLMTTDEALKRFKGDSVQMKIRNISSAIALSLYTTITGFNYTEEYLASPVLIDEFLYCFLESADCPLFKASSHPNSLPGLPKPPPRYISVVGGPQEAVGWSYRLMGFLTSQPSNVPKDNCTNLPLNWFAGFSGEGECRFTTHNRSYALSPAFLDSNYDWKSGKYSTWTESSWRPFSARIFLKPSKIHETVTLAIGFVVMIMSFVIVFLINSKSDVLFESCPVSTISQPAAC